MESRSSNEKSVLQFLIELNNPDLVRGFLSPFIDIKNFSRIARTCSGLNSIFKEPLPIAKAGHYVISNPSLAEIKKILEVLKPDELKVFLQKKVKNVVDHSVRTIINSTLLQLAYGAGYDEMCLDLKTYFERAFGDKETANKEIRKQLIEKFAVENAEKKHTETQDLEIKNRLTELLAAVTQAITNEQFDLGHDLDNKLILSPATHIAIINFRVALDALQPKIIYKGTHFRINTLQEIYNAYGKATATWNMDFNRCELFADAVLSSALSYVPENDAEKFSRGLFYLRMDNQEWIERARSHGTPVLTTHEANDIFYTSLRAPSSRFSNLSGSCFDINFGRPNCGATPGIVDDLQTYIKQKTANLQCLYSSLDSTKRYNQ